MKKFVVIFLLLQIATCNAFGEELFKLPRLFTHYYHHSREHHDTKDFFDFLHKHYSNPPQNDKHSRNHNDEDNDCQLPFKHCDDCSLNFHTADIGFVPPVLNAEPVYYPVRNEGFFPVDDCIESLDICTIWQPPKIA